MRYDYYGLHSCVLFGFRPIHQQAALRFLHFFRHKVFIHCTRLYKVLPFPERADFFRVLWHRLTSRSSLLLLAYRPVCETSPDKNMFFLPYMRFLSVRPDFCRRLPSDSSTSEATSRLPPHDGHPCLWLYASRH